MPASHASEGASVPSIPYHRDLADCLKKHEDGLWDWFSSDELTENADKDARLYLLKNAVRLNEEDHEELHALAREIAGKLGIDAPITLYQASNHGQRNAMLITMTSEVAVYFGGDILSFLSPDEHRALLAHEMAHFLFKTVEDGDFKISDNLLTWICQNGGEPSFQRSLWLSQLYQEIYADRIAVEVCGGFEAPLSLLVKVGAGITNVSPGSYLEQAEEALAVATNDGKYSGAESQSHPELFIRALAMRDWVDDRANANSKLKHMLEGQPQLDALDLLQQARTTALTEAVIETLLKPRFTESERLEILARRYFPHFDRRQTHTVDRDELDREMRALPDGLKSYFCYVLADFALGDPDLDDLVLIDAVNLAANWEMTEVFERIARSDLGIAATRFAQLQASSAKASGSDAMPACGEISA
ncbi:MAG: M48 family metalloprotease [Pseudomonadota bacterium]